MDYAGIGDSAGSWTDPDLGEEWSAASANNSLCRDLGVERVAVVGLRLGATLAASELGRGGEVDDLVLWDPCPTGKAFPANSVPSGSSCAVRPSNGEFCAKTKFGARGTRVTPGRSKHQA